jgi:SNF2 family DNA or RNA helicase
VLCEPVLNPTFEEQAIGRCSRFGQRRAVTVTRLVMEGVFVGVWCRLCFAVSVFA